MESADQGRAPQRDEDEDRAGLVRLALAGLADGALAGLDGRALHIVIDHADANDGWRARTWLTSDSASSNFP